MTRGQKGWSFVVAGGASVLFLQVSGSLHTLYCDQSLAAAFVYRCIELITRKRFSLDKETIRKWRAHTLAAELALQPLRKFVLRVC